MKLLRSPINELYNRAAQQNVRSANKRGQQTLEFSLLMIVIGIVIAGYIMFISPATLTSPVDIKISSRATELACIGILLLATLNRMGVDWLARPLFVFLFLLLATFSYTPEQIIHGEGLLIYTIPIVTSSILLAPWASFVVAGLSILITTVLAVSQDAPLNFMNMVSFLVLALIIWYSESNLKQALTDLGKANQALRAIEERFRWLTKMSGEYVWQLDLHGRVIYISASVEKLHGFTPQEAKQLDYRDFFPPSEIESVTQVFARAIAGEEYQLVQFTSKKKNGSLLPVELSVSPIIQDGVVVGMHGLTRDISELKLAEKALIESQVKLSAIFNNSLDPILVSKTGVFVLVNPAFLKMLGYEDASEVVGRSVLDFVAAESREMMAENIRRRASGKPAPDFYEALALRKDGTTFWVELSISTYELDGETYVLAVLHDLTERKRVEEREHALRDLAEAMSNSAIALNSTLELTDVLEHIENNVGRVVHHDSVGIILLDETRQIAKIVGYHDVHDHTEKMQDFQFTVSQTRNLREMMDSGEPVIVGDTTQYEGWVHTLSSSWIRDCLGVPIKSKGGIIGFLSLASSTPHTFSPQDAERLQVFVSHAAIAIENARLYENVQRLAVTDALTGIYNRTFFEAELTRMKLGRDFPVSIVVADLDNMKMTNDRLGHSAGDELLKHTVQVLHKIFRASDIIARVGGDEFAILLPKTDSATTEQMLTRVRSNLDEHNVIYPDLPIQLSLGTSTATQGDLTTVFIVADQNMYENKAARKSSNQTTD